MGVSFAPWAEKRKIANSSKPKKIGIPRDFLSGEGIDKEVLKNFEEKHPAENKKTIFDFFLIFSKFESALKKHGNPKYKKTSNGKLQPNWDGFIKENKATIVPFMESQEDTPLKRAYKYLLNDPTKFQQGNEEWVNREPDDNTPNLTLILHCVLDMRNNLFHGGKHGTNYARDKSLLDAGIIILDYWAIIDDGIKSTFESEF